MGLDAVEIVMRVEDHFGFTIVVGEVEPIDTVGDSVALIRSRVDVASSAQCLSLPAFLSLRAVIREIVGDKEFRVRPSQSVASCLSPEHRRQLWRRLPELLGAEPHGLRRPRPILAILVALSALLLAGAVAIAAINWRMLPLTLFVAAALIFLLYAATSRLRIVPPDGMLTLGNITRRIVGRTAIGADLDLPDDSAILAELRPIIADILGVDASAVVPEASLADDLGMD